MRVKCAAVLFQSSLVLLAPTVGDCGSVLGNVYSFQNQKPLPRHALKVPSQHIALRGGSDEEDSLETWDFTRARSFDSGTRSYGNNLQPDEGPLPEVPDHSHIRKDSANSADSEEEQYREAVSQQLGPDDWPEGVPGYHPNPFVGMKKPGFFLEEFVDVQSKDPAIRKLNKKLWRSCDAGDVTLAKKLLSQGAEVNAGDPADGFMWTALIHCCAPPPAAAVPGLICKDTAAEVERKRVELVDCLLAHGARVQVTDIYGETPLHYAAVRGYPRLVQKLMQVGVDPFRENMYGNSAQRIAELNQKGNPGCAEAAQVIADAGGYDAGWPGDEMGRQPRPVRAKRREADWQRANAAAREEEEILLEEAREPPGMRVQGASDPLFLQVGGVPPPHLVLPGKDGRPGRLRPGLLEDAEKAEKERARLRAELERKAILGDDTDDLDREKEVWE